MCTQHGPLICHFIHLPNTFPVWKQVRCYHYVLPGVAQLMETALFFMSAVFLADWSSLVFKSGFWVITTWNFTNDKWYYFLALHLNLTCVLYFLKVSVCNQNFFKKLYVTKLSNGATLFTCFAIAENLKTCWVSSNILAHWFTLTIMFTRPWPLKKFWKRRVNLLSLKGMILGLSLQKGITEWAEQKV